jgi:hypothetical protein
MIDLASERVFPLSNPPAWLIGRTGRPVHRTTLERWAKVGVKGGIKLETALLGMTRVSSVEAVERFLAELNRSTPAANQNTTPSAKPTRTPRQRQKASEDAAAKLENAGY